MPEAKTTARDGAAMGELSARRAESSPGRDKLKKNILAIGFLALWITVLIPNVPAQWGQKIVTTSRKVLFPLHAVFGLTGNYTLRLFARPSRRGTACMIALGFHDQTSRSEVLFPPPVSYCVNPGLRWRQDHLHHAFWKYYGMLVLPGSAYRGDFRRGKTPAQFQKDLGDMFCGWARAEGRPVDSVVVGFFRESYDTDYYDQRRQTGSGETRKELQPGLAYHCRQQTLMPFPGPAVVEALKRDHPDLYDVFKAYQPSSKASG